MPGQNRVVVESINRGFTGLRCRFGGLRQFDAHSTVVNMQGHGLPDLYGRNPDLGIDHHNPDRCSEEHKVRFQLSDRTGQKYVGGGA